MQQGVKFQGARASNSTLCLCVGVGRSETVVCRSETTPSQTCGPARIPLHTGSSSVRPSGGERSAKHRPSSGASALKNSVVTTRLHTRLRSGLDRVSPAGRIQGRDPGEPKTQRFMRRGAVWEFQGLRIFNGAELVASARWRLGRPGKFQTVWHRNFVSKRASLPATQSSPQMANLSRLRASAPKTSRPLWPKRPPWWAGAKQRASRPASETPRLQGRQS